MGGRIRSLILLAIIGGFGYYMYQHIEKPGAKPPSSSSSASGGSEPGDGGASFRCLKLAERANSDLHEAARILFKLPVDMSAWESAEINVSSSISAAETRCVGGGTEGEQAALAEIRAALGVMRMSLQDLSGAARGGGGALATVQRQEEIDGHLERARSLSR